MGIGRRYRDRTCEALIPNEVAYRLPNLRGRHQQSEPVLVAVVAWNPSPLILLRLESNQLRFWLSFPYRYAQQGFSSKVSRNTNALAAVFFPAPLHV